MALPSTPDKWPDNALLGDIVAVHVGVAPSLRTFHLHKGALTFYSGYFQAALNGKFKEANELEISLRTESPDIFDVFAQWIYNRRIVPWTGLKADLDLKPNIFFKLWVFGDAHQIPLLQNQVIDMLHEQAVATWKANEAAYITYLYQNTTEDAKLRLYYINFIAKTSHASKCVPLAKTLGWPAEALYDILNIAWTFEREARTTKSRFKEWNMCQYHVHEEGVKCEQSKVQEDKGVPVSK